MPPEQLSMFATGSEHALGDQKTLRFSITKTINAPAQAVYDQWLIPVFIGEWMFGPHVHQEKVVSLHNEARKGGKFTFRVNRNQKDIRHYGEYRVLDIPNKLVFSWLTSAQPNCVSQLTAQFSEHNKKTKLKLTVKLDAKLVDFQAAIKREWAARLSALADKFSEQD